MSGIDWEGILGVDGDDILDAYDDLVADAEDMLYRRSYDVYDDDLSYYEDYEPDLDNNYYSSNSSKRFIYVPYDKREIEAVKRKGGKWDPYHQQWYYNRSYRASRFKRWSHQYSRHYINVPFDEKESAKERGARWDPEAKHFYYWFDEDRSHFEEWLPDHEIVFDRNAPRQYIHVPYDKTETAKVRGIGGIWDEDRNQWYYQWASEHPLFARWKSPLKKHYINVPFCDNEEAKKLGAKWDDENKKWYYWFDEDFHLFEKWQECLSNTG